MWIEWLLLELEVVDLIGWLGEHQCDRSLCLSCDATWSDQSTVCFFYTRAHRHSPAGAIITCSTFRYNAAYPSSWFTGLYLHLLLLSRLCGPKVFCSLNNGLEIAADEEVAVFLLITATLLLICRDASWNVVILPNMVTPGLWFGSVWRTLSSVDADQFEMSRPALPSSPLLEEMF